MKKGQIKAKFPSKNFVINPFFPNGGVERTNPGFVDNSPLTSTETR